MPVDKQQANKAPTYAILRAAAAQSQSSRVYRSSAGNKYPASLYLPLSGTSQPPLTRHQLIGMIRGLFCLLFPKNQDFVLGGFLRQVLNNLAHIR
ncbi:hypothetical protein, partial [Pseudomonas sp. NPDC086278]|uniref:hypothetical protein n=1 Tax=Pseudomonas sp. NPDC086278 TaxID=3390646 RepID=UPI003D0029AF